MTRIKGSNLIEYAIPLALIALLIGITLYYMYSNGSLIKFIVGSSGANYNNNTGKLVLGNNTFKLGGEKVNYNSDGSIEFVVEGQKVNISTQIQDLASEATETSGVSGSDEIVKEIANMIRLHKSEFPDQQVPVEVSFGTGARDLIGETYAGKAEVNSTTIKVGNHMVILQKDQQCTNVNAGQSVKCGETEDVRMGAFRIDGNVSSSNVFNGTIQSGQVKGLNNKTLKADVSGKKLNGKFTYGGDSYYSSGSLNNGTWDFDFSKPDKSFNL